MSQWTDRILSHFTADLTRLWVACDPDEVLLDEKLLGRAAQPWLRGDAVRGPVRLPRRV
jgi:hypothetical protein